MSNDSFEIKKPAEGANTLFAQFSVFRLDEILAEMRQAEDPEAYLQTSYSDVAVHVLEKLRVLARGETPPDDFEESDVRLFELLDARTLVVELEDDRYQPGDLLYVRGERWVVGTRKDSRLTLKRF
jgi:hypothetical protein